MIFNGKDFHDYLKILRIDKQILPPIVHHTTPIPGMVGVLHNRTDLGARPIEVEIELEEDEILMEEQYRELSALLYTTEPEKLVFKDESDKFYLAKINSVSTIQEIRHFGVMDISFICFYPLAISEDETVFRNINSKQLVNEGTYGAPGIIEISFSEPAENVRVELLNTGDYIYVTNNFEAGDKLFINLEDESVRKNETLIMNEVFYESDFFLIPSGEFSIKVDKGKADLTIRKRWL